MPFKGLLEKASVVSTSGSYDARCVPLKTPSADNKNYMDANINLLFVSTSVADELVLTSLLAEKAGGANVRVFAVTSAKAFYDALYSETRYQIIVVDERQRWSSWRDITMACAKNRPNALQVLLVEPKRHDRLDSSLDAEVTTVYPRSSAGFVALARLVGKLDAQERSFSLRHEPGDAEETAVDEPNGEERERLVYAVSHDLQDPLQLARRYADILNEDHLGELGDSGSKVLGHLQFNLARTQEMLDELLDFSRLQNAEPDCQLVDFNDLLDEAVELYKVTLDEIGGSVSRQHRLPTLMVDRRQFQRVFQNLIGNAIKFRSERPLHVTARAQRVRSEWRIGIKDNGIGISDEDTKRIFGMFERAGSVEDYPGTGMGLAICKRIIHNHGGNIWVRSSLGSGSVFIFSVPQAEEAVDMTAG